MEELKKYYSYGMVAAVVWFVVMALMVLLYTFFDLKWWVLTADQDLKGFWIFLVNTALTVAPAVVFFVCYELRRELK